MGEYLVVIYLWSQKKWVLRQIIGVTVSYVPTFFSTPANQKETKATRFQVESFFPGNEILHWFNFDS